MLYKTLQLGLIINTFWMN